MTSGKLLMHAIADLSSEKLIRLRSQLIMALYGSFHFVCGNREAIRLYITSAAFPVPPAAAKMRVVKDPCSISQMCCSYAGLFSCSKLEYKEGKNVSDMISHRD